ncbi:MAG: YbgA family protein [Aeromonas sp.]
MELGSEKITVGISACLLGHQVRFDGGHKRSTYCERELGQVFDYQSICPEMAIGLGTPRPTIRLVKRGEVIHAEASNGSFDVTDKLIAFSQTQTQQLGHLSGYILCAKSPSCGMERVKLYTAGQDGQVGGGNKEAVGLYAQALMAANPLLPVEEDGRLCDPLLRENFVMRVFAYRDWQKLQASPVTASALIAFHSRYKYLLMAQSPSHYRSLGKLLANAGKVELAPLCRHYGQQFMQALGKHANRRSHTNVLLHVQGYFKQQLNYDQKQELRECIEQYRLGLMPLLAPLTLIRHYLRQYPHSYLSQQVYLSPHPACLKLRYGL